MIEDQKERACHHERFADRPELHRTDEPHELDLAQYWSIIVKGRRIIAAAVVAGVLIAFFVSIFSKPTYRAKVVLDVEREKESPFTVSDTPIVQSREPEFLPTQTKLIKSREIAARVVDRLNLNAVDPAQKESGFFRSLKFWAPNSSGPLRDSKAASDDQADLIAEQLSAAVETVPVRGTNLVEVYYTAGDPKTAAQIANAVANAYIDWTLESKYQVLGQASQFLTSQIEQLKADIDRKEQQLQAYGDQKDIVSIDPQTNSTMQNLESLNKDYADAVTERVSKEAKYHELMTSRPDAIADNLSNGLISQLRADQAKLEREYAEKLQLFKPQWPAMLQLKAQIDKGRQHLAEQVRDTVSKAREVARNEYVTAQRREESLKAVLQGQKTEAMTLNKNAVEYNNLRTEVTTKRALLDSLLKRQAETQVSSRLRGERISNIRVVDRALPPRVRFTPSYSHNVTVSLVLSLLAGVGIIFLQDYLDRSLRTPEQVSRFLHLPTLGVIPASAASSKPYYGYTLPLRKSPKPAAAAANQIELLPHKSPRSTVAEAYRSFRTALLLSQAGGVKSVVVTSSMPAEGKTSTALNLAVVFGQLEKRVLLVDADLHKPRLHEILRVSNRNGLVSILAESIDPVRVVHTTAIPGLHAITGGPTSPNPSGLLASKAMRRFLEWAESSYDIVIIDSPPVSPIADAILLGDLTDGVILCVQAGRTPRDHVGRVRDELLRSNVRILGVLLNNLQEDGGRYGYYYYGKQHYAAPEQVVMRSESGERRTPFINANEI